MAKFRAALLIWFSQFARVLLKNESEEPAELYPMLVKMMPNEM
jgi:hypothetical protein